MTLRPKDGPLLAVTKWVARTAYLLNLDVTRWRDKRRGQKHWVLGGECHRCAACCESPAIHVDRLTWHLSVFRRPFLWWQRVVNGFELIGRQKTRVFVFKCSYFDTATRSCTSYETRPGMCRDYPRILLDQGWPEFLPGCGYRAIAANSAQMLVTLNATPLDPQKREELKRKMRIE